MRRRRRRAHVCVCVCVCVCACGGGACGRLCGCKLVCASSCLPPTPPCALSCSLRRQAGTSSSVADGVRTALERGGVLGLYRGAGLALARDVPFFTINLVV